MLPIIGNVGLTFSAQVTFAPHSTETFTVQSDFAGLCRNPGTTQSLLPIDSIILEVRPCRCTRLLPPRHAALRLPIDKVCVPWSMAHGLPLPQLMETSCLHHDVPAGRACLDSAATGLRLRLRPRPRPGWPYGLAGPAHFGSAAGADHRVCVRVQCQRTRNGSRRRACQTRIRRCTRRSGARRSAVRPNARCRPPLQSLLGSAWLGSARLGSLLRTGM